MYHDAGVRKYVWWFRGCRPMIRASALSLCAHVITVHSVVNISLWQNCLFVSVAECGWIYHIGSHEWAMHFGENEKRNTKWMTQIAQKARKITTIYFRTHLKFMTEDFSIASFWPLVSSISFGMLHLSSDLDILLLLLLLYCTLMYRIAVVWWFIDKMQCNVAVTDWASTALWGKNILTHGLPNSILLFYHTP